MVNIITNFCMPTVGPHTSNSAYLQMDTSSSLSISKSIPPSLVVLTLRRGFAQSCSLIPLTQFLCTSYLKVRVQGFYFGMACSLATPYSGPVRACLDYWACLLISSLPLTTPYASPCPRVQPGRSSFKSQTICRIMVGLIEISDFKNHMK